MAWKLLKLVPAPVHTFKHDIQSFLWVLLFLVHFYIGPGSEGAIRQDDMRKYWCRWIGSLNDTKKMRASREKLMKNRDDRYSVFVDATFSKYFEGLKPLAHDLRQAIVDSASPQGRH